MGRVYKAHDELLNRDVALKLLKPQHADNEQFVERFRRESKNVAALSHPNIVSVFDAGEDSDGSPYMAMEYIGGGTLADRISKKGPLDSLEAAGIALQVARALEEAHEQGVIHRDIKPHNIFLVEDAALSDENAGNGLGGIASGGVKVGDFGIARAAAETAMTETSLILGTVRYLSPEQATGEAVGPESDLYSLGIVLYEMITGGVPFDAENPIAIAMKHISEKPVLPRKINPGASEGIQAVTLKLLSKAPEDRYRSASDLVEDLECVARGLAPAGITVEDETEFLQRPPDEEPTRPARGRGTVTPVRSRKSRAGRRVAVLAVLAVLVAGLALAGTENDFSTLYAGFNAGDPAREVAEIENVPTPSAIAAPVTRANVPGVVGDEEAAAVSTLEDAGFEVEKETRETSDREEGTVDAQNPSSGERVQRGSTVTITVAEAPSGVTLPDLAGLDLQEAEARLSEAGLELGQQDEAYSDSTPAGLIVDQSPAVGTEIPTGDAVDVTLSSGPEPVAPPATVPEQESAPEPEPAPATVSEPTPEPATETVPESEVPEPAPAPVTVPDPEPAPEPVVEQEPEPAPEPVVEQEPEPAPEPVIEQELEPASEPAVEQEMEQEPAPVETEVPEDQPSSPQQYPVVPSGSDPETAGDSSDPFSENFEPPMPDMPEVFDD